MYEFIEGEITELNPSYVIIKTQGIGYYVQISLNTFSQLEGKKTIKLLIHQIVREDALILYGFGDKQEREIFRELISVSGVGANTARMILSSLTTDEIQQAIIEADVNELKKIKGIGAKSAQRIIVELKDKIGKNVDVSKIFTPQNNTIREEAFSALVVLGFSKNAVNKTVDKILSQEKDITVEELVKKSLKNL